MTGVMQQRFRALDGGARPARDHPSDTHRPRLRVNISRSGPARFALCYKKEELILAGAFAPGGANARHRSQRPCFSPALRLRHSMEPKFPAHVYVGQPKEENTMGKGLLLWLIGIPIPIILLIWLFGGLH